MSMASQGFLEMPGRPELRLADDLGYSSIEPLDHAAGSEVFWPDEICGLNLCVLSADTINRRNQTRA